MAKKEAVKSGSGSKAAHAAVGAYAQVHADGRDAANAIRTWLVETEAEVEALEVEHDRLKKDTDAEMAAIQRHHAETLEELAKARKREVDALNASIDTVRKKLAVAGVGVKEVEGILRAYDKTKAAA